MNSELSLEKFIRLAVNNSKIVVHQENTIENLSNNHINHLFNLLNKDHSDAFIFENNNKQTTDICFDLIFSLNAFGKDLYLQVNQEDKIIREHPVKFLRNNKKLYKAASDKNLNTLAGGLVTIFSYDGIRYFEDIPDKNNDNLNLPDACFYSYKNNMRLNLATNKVLISTVVDLEQNKKNRSKDILLALYLKAMASIKQLFNTVDAVDTIISHNKNYISKHHESLSLQSEVCDDFINVDLNDKHFKKILLDAKSKILDGDIFQVVLSRSYKTSKKLKASPLVVYELLKNNINSAYNYYFAVGNSVVVGASPEKLITVNNKIIETSPLAGTRRMTGNKVDDECSKTELLADEKEQAEHIMLVDLARNDIGSVAVPGTVKVNKFKKIEQFSTVMHISSTIRAELNSKFDVFDIIGATFPAGTLSGAPKIRAMEIIDELESSKRGLYGGVVFCIDNHNNIDSAILIRTIEFNQGYAYVRAGAGIVFDSSLESECLETKTKARSVLLTLQQAEGLAI